MKVPSTTVEFLDALKAKRGWSTDYQLWKALGWKQTTVSNYRNGRAAIAGQHAIRIADELGLSHAYVLACGNVERERDGDVARAWKAIADHFKSAAAIILIALGFLTGAQDARAAQGNPALRGDLTVAVPYIYYAKSLLRWLAMGLRTTFPALVPA